MIGRRQQTELLPPSQYTRERDADKDARQKVLDEQNKTHREQVRQLAEASFKLRELDVKMEVEELKSKVRQATIAREQALKLMNELGRLDITKPESYAKRLEIQQKYPAAVLDKNGADFLKGWVDNFDTAQKSANDIKAKREEYENELRMKREEHFRMLNDANIHAKGEDLAGNKTTTISTGQTVKPLNLTTTSATVTAGGLHPRYEAPDPEKARAKAEADALKAKDAASKVLPDIDKRMQAELGVSLSQVQDPSSRMRRVNPSLSQGKPNGDYTGIKDQRSDPAGSHYAFDVRTKAGKIRTVTIPMDRFKSYADEYSQAIVKPAAPKADATVQSAPLPPTKPAATEAPAVAPAARVAPTTAARVTTPTPTTLAATEPVATPLAAPKKLPIYSTNPGALRIEDVPDAPEVKSRAEFDAMPEGAAVRYGSKIIWKPVKAAAPAVASASDDY